jgi:type I restriction enzyme, S subunit
MSRPSSPEAPRVVTLGDVAEERSIRENNPSESDYDRFVGSEHIERYELRVRRWGSTRDVTSAMKVFRKGDYLLVRRSLYASDFRERAPRAGFAGLCSGDILTIREKPNAVVDGFLSVVLNSPKVWEYVAATATGSITRRIKWRDLSKYEFILPSATEQRRVVRAMDGCADLEDELSGVVSAAHSLLDASLLAAFDTISVRVPLAETCRSPITYGIVQAGPDVQGGVPYVRVSEMTGREALDPKSMLRTSPEISAAYSRTVLERDDIVMALRGVPGLCHIVQDSMVGANLSRGVARIAPRREMNPRYLLWALRSFHVQAAILQYANGWKGEDLREITIGQLRTVPVPWVPREEQDMIAGELDAIHGAWVASRERQSRFNRVTAALREEERGGAP